MNQEKPSVCREMFRHACAFSECADMAEKEFCHETADISWYTTPAIVNSAFACEVFLKALLDYYDVSFKKSHKLKELYDGLPPELKERIRQNVYVIHSRWKNAFGQDLLENISDSFAEWRYSYEKWGKGTMKIETGFLTAFRNVLRETCCYLFFRICWNEYAGGGKNNTDAYNIKDGVQG